MLQWKSYDPAAGAVNVAVLPASTVTLKLLPSFDVTVCVVVSLFEPATLERVSRSLEALALGGAPEGASVGRLVDDLSPPGFDAFAGLSLTAPAPAAPSKPKGPVAAVPKVDSAAAGRARRAAIEDAQEKVYAAEAEVRRNKKAVADAAATADKARAEQREAEKILSEAAQRARRATESAEKAGFAARQTGTALAEAERALEAARALLDRKKREL